ncbi:VOC family protein [Candidatus Uabimicrobium amorphum]|uniref:Glyoxalase/bleomycin resistanceprotein/dioxygenase superfamily protein n=1 Tax=Uabimicrobium amorphum TaxID=2596890 RepID=A0A5S9IS38_UABAM|nr:VOC family protein [Candidatus Uabimicrobium amorphum]BBM86697.1 glyoxalase/bleomycin resistanceprotein/dioxygenase superfamily protein [Candidatus Uabimicrobium amorphum]
MISLFHLAVPVGDLNAARDFYKNVLGCSEGRSSDSWVDFNLFGHQFVIHHVPGYVAKSATNPVDGHEVPIPHFGVILTMDAWCALRDSLHKADISFVIEPYIRFKGEPGEQATMFFHDPSNNALEFKAFANFSQVFAK